LTLAGFKAGNITLSWPAYAANYQLYATTNLAAPVVWWTVTNAVSSQGGSNSVAVPVGTDQRFFQLHSQ
jgi:hypothetical protein